MALETSDMIINPIEHKQMLVDYEINGETIKGRQLFGVKKNSREKGTFKDQVTEHVFHVKGLNL